MILKVTYTVNQILIPTPTTPYFEIQLGHNHLGPESIAAIAFRDDDFIRHNLNIPTRNQIAITPPSPENWSPIVTMVLTGRPLNSLNHTQLSNDDVVFCDTSVHHSSFAKYLSDVLQITTRTNRTIHLASYGYILNPKLLAIPTYDLTIPVSRRQLRISTHLMTSPYAFTVSFEFDESPN